jgi:hypothetical protein
VVEGGGRILCETGAVPQKKRFLFSIDKGRPNECLRIAILGEHALLAAAQGEPFKIDSQGQDGKSFSSMNRSPVAEKQGAEMAPPLGPELIHFFWGGIHA